MLVRVITPRGVGKDDGAAIVTVVIVMLVGFVIASVVAASVMSTIRANAGNSAQTQAFIAAESGRDEAVEYLSSVGTCSAGALDFEGTSPDYSATVYVTDSETPPTSKAGLGSPACPTDDT